jgi:CHASE2 domain-containing sensor protein
MISPAGVVRTIAAALTGLIRDEILAFPGRLRKLRTIFGDRVFFLLLSLFLGFWVAFLGVRPVGEWLENTIYDVKHSFGARFREPDPRLLIVGLDMKTLAEKPFRWPWPRDVLAQEIAAVGACQPACQVIDILFQGESNPEADAALGKAIERLANIALVSIVEEKQTPFGLSLERFESLPSLVEKAWIQGFVWGGISGDGRLRSFRLKDHRLNEESCALKLARALGIPDPTGGEIDQNQSLICFSKKNGGIPIISLSGFSPDPAALRKLVAGKIVVFGVTARVAHDFHPTPLGTISGAETLAFTIDTLLQNKTRRHLADFPVYRFVAGLFGSFLGFFFFTFQRGFLLSPLALSLFLLGSLTLSEAVLIHPPFAPLIMCWIWVTLFCSLVHYFHNLFQLQEIYSEAETAKLIQSNLLPLDPIALGDYEIYGCSKSASHLGGDYFDYSVQEGKFLLMFVGDATGHGIPAALAMTIAKASFLLALNKSFQPAEFLETINQTLLSALKKKRFMTAALFRINTETHEYEYWNCGHPFPYLLEVDGTIQQLESSGTFLGRRPDYKLPIPFHGVFMPGSRLVFYTDGMVESFLTDNDKWDAFTLFQNYLQKQPLRPIKDACHGILYEHPFFRTGAAQPDDFTVIMIERRGG